MLRILFVLFLFALSARAWAGDGILTLEDAVTRVLESNEDVRAASYRAQAVEARIPQAKGLSDPMVGVTVEDVPFGQGIKAGEEINYRIEQDLPFPGKRHVRAKAARFDAQAAKESARARVRDVLLDLKSTYYVLYRLDRSLGVNRQTQALMRQLLGSTETAYAAGQTTADAPLKAQLELTKLRNEEMILTQDRRTHVAHLKALMGTRGDHDGDVRLPTALTWPRLKASLEEIQTMASASRPELGALRAAEKGDEARVTAAKQSFVPDFRLGFEYNQRPAGREDAWTGTAMINLPVFAGKKSGEIREAKASLRATKAEHDSMEIHTRHEIEQAYGAVKTAQKLVSSYQREILPQARTTLEASRTAYAGAKVDFLTLIEAATAYNDLQLSYYDTQARLGTAFAELERLVGSDFDSFEGHP